MNLLKPVFRGNFAEPLRFGHCLEICAKAQEGGIRFSLSLSTDDTSTTVNFEIDLLIVVNLQQDQITCKKFLNNEWLDTESASLGTADLFREFKIYIIMADGKFHISINGQPVTTSKYRLRLSQLNFVEISGDLEYVRQMDHRKYFPHPWPPIQMLEDRLHFSGDVPMAIKPGHVMVVSAQLLGNELGRFIVHLRDVFDMDRQELHLSVRFDTKSVIRTAKNIPHEEHYDFDIEDTDGAFPFQDFYQPFKLAFAFLANEVKIAKDGIFLYSFSFRTPNVLPVVGGLKIFGINDVVVKVNELKHFKMNHLCEHFEYSSLL
uniref:Galectin n=1 Tax=Stomoxys calcitrans TaxID=35570 RepID=A0A1I8PWN2_STOCA